LTSSSNINPLVAYVRPPSEIVPSHKPLKFSFEDGDGAELEPELVEPEESVPPPPQAVKTPHIRKKANILLSLLNNIRKFLLAFFDFWIISPSPQMNFKGQHKRSRPNVLCSIE
jgi:hypothetical protein